MNNKRFTLTTNMTRLLALIFLFSLSIHSWAVSSSDYSSLNGKSGSTLWDAVHSRAKSGYSTLSYAGLWTAYKTTDIYPTNSSHPDYVASKAGMIWDLYGGCAFSAGTDQCGSYSSECDCYNREHSIPKSWFGGSESSGTPGTDIFHVVPTDGKINNTRSNYAFGEVQTAKTTHNTNGIVNKLSTSGGAKSITITNTMLGTSSTQSPGSSKQVFEPDDVYKGDFARGYLGTLLKWAGDYQAFTTGDGSVIFSGTYTEAGHWGLTEYGIALLLKWHRQDPVSQKEIDRNNGIESTQGNRNPFIDYPILAEYIWGKYAGNSFNTSNAVGSFESAFTPGVSDGDKSSNTPTLAVSATSITMDPVAVNGTSTATFTVTGANLTSTISISVSGSYYSVSPTTITSANANKTNTITVTYHPTATGTHNGTITISSSGATSKSVSVSGQCTTVYTATWMANGSNFHSNTAASGTAPAMPSDTPDDCSSTRKFVGWTSTANYSGSSAPSNLFTSSAPTISGNTIFYAVYADVTSSGTSTATFDASDITATPLNGTLAWTHSASGITLTLSAGQRYTNGTPNTFTVTKGESNYAQLSGNKTITQVEATISGTNYKINSVSPGTLSTSSTTQTITGINSTSLTMYATASYQIRLCSLVVSYSSISYNNYSTVCSTASSCTSAPTVGAASSSNVTTTSAAVNCSSGITSLGSTGCTISSYGFVYGTTSNPTVNSGTQVQVGASYTSTGNAFNTSLSGLSPNTTYYVRPYATNGYNTAYGTQTNFKTQALTQYTVTWHYSGGSTSVSYYSGESLALPTNPTTCDNGRVFKGWTTSSTYSGNGTDLMTSASGTVTANADYYAVYATASISGGSTTTKYTYNKVTSTDDIEDGDYLIVYEDGNVAFNGALSTLDAVSNTISITIANDSVTNFATVDAAKFTIATSDGSILSASGKYIGATSDANSLNSGTTAYTNTLSINNGDFVCVSSGGAYLRYNSTSGQTRFRYYKSSSYTNQKAIQLYKKVGTTAGGGSSTTTYSDYSTSCSTSAYIVTWNATANGGTCTTATSEINAGDELGTLPTATKEGHSFDGWFTASTGGTKITTATIPTGDVEYFAQFTPNTYTITYNKGTNGTGTVASTSKTYGVDATLSESTFTREGYTQDGWSTTDGGDKVYDLGGTYTTNEATTLYPHWTALPTYTVTFKVGTGNHATFVGWAGKSISGISTPSACDGYTFVGWSTQQYGTTNTVAPAIDYTGLVPETNTTYYAVFSTNGAAVGSTLWAENFAHFVTNTPSAAGSGTGTNIYGDASITYAQSSDNTKAYDEILAGGSSPELLLNKSNATWTISGIPMANATAMSLTFLSNKTTFGVTTNETTKLEVNGSGKSWTISLVNGQTAPTTFNLIITNTGSQNARLDNVQLKVTAIEDKGAIFTTSKTFTITVNSENNTQGTVTIQQN